MALGIYTHYMLAFFRRYSRQILKWRRVKFGGKIYKYKYKINEILLTHIAQYTYCTPI